MVSGVGLIISDLLWLISAFAFAINVELFAFVFMFCTDGFCVSNCSLLIGFLISNDCEWFLKSV